MRRVKKIKKHKAQSFPFVMVLAAVLSLFGAALLNIFSIETKHLVKTSCIIQKQDLASLALEHAILKLQQGTNWYNVSSLTNFRGYSKEFESPLGKYAIHISDGNLFLTDLNDPTSRQAKDEYKTIGIKVKTKILDCTGAFYAVVQRKMLGGPLISKGRIDLPCTDAKINDSNFYWGDIFSANTNNGYCRIPRIEVAKGSPTQYWLPKVYSAADIYTSVGYTGGRFGPNYYFASTYDDMSPTAHCHPFSQYATAPDVDFDYFKGLAKENKAYYGPANIPGVGPNPYYNPAQDISLVSQANVVTIMAKLKSPSSVLFIDTTDGLPVRYSPCNTYSGSVSVTANLSTDKTLRFYVDNNNQYMTYGQLFIMGPLMLIGHSPSNISNTYGYTWGYGFYSGNDCDDVGNVRHPDNYYYPQTSDSIHYVRNLVDDSQSRLVNTKHAGLLYVNGELRIGGPRVGTSTYSNICIYGTILLGEKGHLKMDTTNDNPYLYVYYDKNINLFGFQGVSVELVSFGEITYLIPTPVPEYPF
jgi:hypothetical protein